MESKKNKLLVTTVTDSWKSQTTIIIDKKYDELEEIKNLFIY
jgi:hypothetical protein